MGNANLNEKGCAEISKEKKRILLTSGLVTGKEGIREAVAPQKVFGHKKVHFFV